MFNLFMGWRGAVWGGLGIFISWFVTSTIDERITAHKVKLAIEAANKVCEDNQKITRRVSHDYQSKVSTLNAELASLRGLHSTECVPTTGSAGGHDAIAGSGQLSRPHAVAAGDLIDFAGDCEKGRLQLLACQDFIRQTWTAKGQ